MFVPAKALLSENAGEALNNREILGGKVCVKCKVIVYDPQHLELIFIASASGYDTFFMRILHQVQQQCQWNAPYAIAVIDTL